MILSLLKKKKDLLPSSIFYILKHLSINSRLFFFPLFFISLSPWYISYSLVSVVYTLHFLPPVIIIDFPPPPFHVNLFIWSKSEERIVSSSFSSDLMWGNHSRVFSHSNFLWSIPRMHPHAHEAFRCVYVVREVKECKSISLMHAAFRTEWHYQVPLPLSLSRFIPDREGHTANLICCLSNETEVEEERETLS